MNLLNETLQDKFYLLDKLGSYKGKIYCSSVRVDNDWTFMDIILEDESRREFLKHAVGKIWMLVSPHETLTAFLEYEGPTIAMTDKSLGGFLTDSPYTTEAVRFNVLDNFEVMKKVNERRKQCQKK